MKANLIVKLGYVSVGTCIDEHLARVNLFTTSLNSWHINIGFVQEHLYARLRLICISFALVFK